MKGGFSGGPDPCSPPACSRCEGQDESGEARPAGGSLPLLFLGPGGRGSPPTREEGLGGPGGWELEQPSAWWFALLLFCFQHKNVLNGLIPPGVGSPGYPRGGPRPAPLRVGGGSGGCGTEAGRGGVGGEAGGPEGAAARGCEESQGIFFL